MKNKKIIIICLIMIILAIVISLGVKLYFNKDLENQRQKLQETQEKIWMGWKGNCWCFSSKIQYGNSW